MDINKLMPALGLGNVVKDLVSVSGGLLHKMYHVTTSAGEYGVKVLNPNIMQRPHALQNTIDSEKIAKAFEGLIPLIASLEIGGQQIQYMDGAYCLVFPWMDGMSVFYGEITTKHCAAVGSILGKMQRRNLQMDGMVPEESSFQMFPWGEMLEIIFEKMPEMRRCYKRPKQLWEYGMPSQDTMDNDNKKWVSAYQDALQDIEYWNRKACEAGEYLSQIQVISHRDLDPKNVMWKDDMPYVIDWEAAGYVNPFQEFLEVVNAWTDDGKGNLVKEKFDVLFAAYRRYMDIKDVQWDAVLNGSSIGMLGWLEYNLKRALGLEASDQDEISLGEEQVLGTIRELYTYQTKMELLRAWFA